MNSLIRLLGAAVLLLQGCSYAISPDIAHIADRTLTLARLQADPPAYRDKTVILGGTITRTKTGRNGTYVEVQEKELDYWGRPRRTDRTAGRFLLFQQRHLDVMVFAPGREITAAGVVTGAEEVLLDGSSGVAVLINAIEIRLWPREKPGWDKPAYLDPLHDPSTPEGKFGY